MAGPAVQPKPPASVDYSNLANTLLPVWALMQSLAQGQTPEAPTLGEAQQGQDMDQLHAQVQAQQQQAQQAGQQYQQAATAPQGPPPSNFVNQLFGNTASVLGQQPEYGRRAFEQGQDLEKTVAQHRAQNLAALKDQYEQLAHQAETSGKTEQAAAYRQKIDSATKALQLVTKGMTGEQGAQGLATKGQQATDLQTLKGNQGWDLEIQKENARWKELQAKIGAGAYSGGAGGAGSEDLDAIFGNSIIHTDSADVVDTRGLIGKARNSLVMEAKRRGIPVPDANNMATLDEIQGAKMNIYSVMEQAGAMLPQTPMERPMWAAHVWKSRVTQEDPAVTAFDNWRASAIKSLRATAGQKGFRINEAEIELAVKYDIPSIFDTAPVARQKMQNIMTMLNNSERVITSNDWRGMNAELAKHSSLQAGKKVKVIDAEGNVSEVDAGQVSKVIADGGARVVENTAASRGMSQKLESPRGSARTYGNVMRTARGNETANGEPDYNAPAEDNDPEDIRQYIGAP